MVEPAVALAGPREELTYLVQLEQASIARSLENLMTFDYIAEAVQRSELQLHGAWFDIDTGHVLVLKGGAYVDVDTLVRQSAAGSSPL